MKGHLRSFCALVLIFSVNIPTALAVGSCTESSLDLELVLTTGTDGTIHPFAKCFSSMTVSVLPDCTLTVAAHGLNNFVQALWSAATTYNQVTECNSGASLEFNDQATASTTTALGSLMSTSLYDEGMTATVAVAAGLVTITANGVDLKYRASGQSGSTTGIFGTVGAPTCAVATECASAASGCGAGRYPVLIGNTATYICALCSSGTWSDAGSTACTKCSGGSALAAVGSTAVGSCTGCLAGTFATPGSSDCRPCSPGMFQDAAGQNSCKSCPSTWVSNTYGATQCVKCTNGRPAFCSSGCNTTPGSSGVFTATMSGSALNAAAGWTAGYSYPGVLNPCSPASTLLSFTVDETCTVEVYALGVTTEYEGLMCSDPSNTDVDLTLYYVDASTLMSRLDENVPKGSIVKVVPKASTTDTVTMTVIAATSSYITPSGTISGDLVVNGGSLVGTTGTSSCPAGTLASGAGSTLSCSVCDAGFSCATPTGSAATCAAGTFSVMGQAACTSCPASTYTPEEGSTLCAPCSGTVGNSGTTCDGSVDCGDGKQLNPATNVCECAPGWTPGSGGACDICAANTYSEGGTDTCHSCASADPTKPYAAEGSDSCSPCPAGQAKVSGVCTRCAGGQQPASGGSSCVACPSGYFNPDSGGFAQYDTCQKCSAGNTSTDKLSCTACAAGTASSDGVTCVACSAGSYAPEGAKKCTSCPGGSEQNTAKTGCTKCAAGTYREPFSSGGCLACDAGTAAKAGSDICTVCMPGTYAGASAAACTPCAVNTYSGDSGANSCTPCQSGYTTGGETGATECGGCGVGTYFDSGSSACLECSAGYYQDRAGQKSCKKCPIGTFTDVTGANSCDLCPAGQYNSVSGATSCRTCPGGTYSSAGKGSCSICARGKYSAPGSTACTSCSAGYYANKLGSRTCTACPTGSKCPGTGSTGPTPCAKGSYQSKPAQTTCLACPKKTYSNKIGATKCTACATATRPGSTTCTSRRRALLFTRLDTHTL